MASQGYTWAPLAGLSDMAPRFSTDYSANGCPGDPHLGCYPSLRDAFRDAAADESYGVVCQSGLRQLSSSGDALRLSPGSTAVTCGLTTFGDHVIDIILMCPGEQVIRSDAGRVVAVVKYPEAGRDGADVKAVGEAVRFDTAVFTAAKSNVAVAGSGVSAHPKPAGSEFGEVGRNRAVFVDFLPESIFNRLAQMKPSAPATTVRVDQPLNQRAAVGTRLVTLSSHLDQPPGVTPWGVSAPPGHLNVSILPYFPGVGHA